MSSSDIITDVTPSGHVATHDVSFSGVAGSVFWTLLSSVVLFLVAYTTIGWQAYTYPGETDTRQVWVGLWKNCMCDDIHIHDGEAWFKGSRAMFTLALIFLVAALTLCVVYMFVPNVKKTIVLIVCSSFSFMSFVFLLVGVSVFGAKTTAAAGGQHQSYSFVLAVLAMIMTLGAAVLSVFQMRISGII